MQYATTFALIEQHGVRNMYMQCSAVLPCSTAGVDGVQIMS
jgi:hypothetical protein